MNEALESPDRLAWDFYPDGRQAAIVLTLGSLRLEIIDAGEPDTHQPVLIDSNLFVAIRTKPIYGVERESIVYLNGAENKFEDK